MAQTCGSSVVKILLMIVNFIILAIGIGVFYVGFKLIDYSSFKLSDVDFKNISYVILVIGAVIVLIAGLGFIGACCSSSALLNCYGFLLVVLIALEVYAVYSSIKHHSNIMENVQKGIMDAIGKIKENSDAAKVLQEIQSKLHCCGWNGPSDYNGDPLSSCCGKYDGKDNTGICALNDVVYKEGCKEKFSTLETLFGSSTGLGIVLILLELILIFAACCLARDL